MSCNCTWDSVWDFGETSERGPDLNPAQGANLVIVLVIVLVSDWRGFFISRLIVGIMEMGWIADSSVLLESSSLDSGNLSEFSMAVDHCPIQHHYLQSRD